MLTNYSESKNSKPWSNLKVILRQGCTLEGFGVPLPWVTKGAQNRKKRERERRENRKKRERKGKRKKEGDKKETIGKST